MKTSYYWTVYCTSQQLTQTSKCRCSAGAFTTNHRACCWRKYIIRPSCSSFKSPCGCNCHAYFILCCLKHSKWVKRVKKKRKWKERRKPPPKWRRRCQNDRKEKRWGNLYQHKHSKPAYMSENNTFVLCFIEIGGFRGFNSRISVSGREKDAGDRECVWPSVTQVRVHVYRCESITWLLPWHLTDSSFSPQVERLSMCASWKRRADFIRRGIFQWEESGFLIAPVGECVAMLWSWFLADLWWSLAGQSAVMFQKPSWPPYSGLVLVQDGLLGNDQLGPTRKPDTNLFSSTGHIISLTKRCHCKLNHTL